MELTKNSIWNSFRLLILISVVALNSCQKNDLTLTRNQDDVALQEKQTTNEETVSHSLARLLLERYFRVQTDGLTEEEISAKYAEMVPLLPQETQNKLTDLIEKARAQNQAEMAGQLDSRSSQSQSVLTGTDQAFGSAVAMFSNRIYVGSPEEQKVFEYKKIGQSPTLVGEITPSVNAPGFGARVSASNNWLAVAAPGDFGDPGKVFLFKKMGNNWVEQAILNGPAGETSFGSAGVVIKGNTVVVSSFGQFTPFPQPFIGGTISVFNRTGNNWGLCATLSRPGYEWFAIDLDDSGNRIAASGITRDGVGIGVESASIFSEGPTGWAFEQELTNPDFSIALDVDIDGNKVVVSALFPGDRQFLFTKNGGTWGFAQELVHPLSIDGAYVDMKGNRIVIGAASFDNAVSDAVYAFDKIGGAYQLTETFTPTDGGINVTINDIAIFGNTIVIGCQGNFDVPNALGKVYVFK